MIEWFWVLPTDEELHEAQRRIDAGEVDDRVAAQNRMTLLRIIAPQVEAQRATAEQLKRIADSMTQGTDG